MGGEEQVELGDSLYWSTCRRCGALNHGFGNPIECCLCGENLQEPAVTCDVTVSRYDYPSGRIVFRMEE